MVLGILQEGVIVAQGSPPEGMTKVLGLKNTKKTASGATATAGGTGHQDNGDDIKASDEIVSPPVVAKLLVDAMTGDSRKAARLFAFFGERALKHPSAVSDIFQTLATITTKESLQHVAVSLERLDLALAAPSCDSKSLTAAITSRNLEYFRFFSKNGYFSPETEINIENLAADHQQGISRKYDELLRDYKEDDQDFNQTVLEAMWWSFG